jgi:hypothetical protein
VSYLDLPRLTFSGLFEADVNTINNDVRHYDIATYEPRFRTVQEPASETGTVYNGWWNPRGSNAFRLLRCRVTGGVSLDGMALEELALRLRVDSQTGRTSAKLVDLDPQFQFASGIWGLRIALASDDVVLMSAAFRQACFRDIFFGRVAGVDGSPGASARFTGYLDDIVWDGSAMKSPLLDTWRILAERSEGRLSMSLMTYGYRKAPNSNDFTYGLVVGTIAPWKRGEPRSFAPGRRFAPLGGSPFASAAGFGYMNAALSQNKRRLTVDLGNSLPMAIAQDSVPGDAGQRPIVLRYLGPLQVVVLKDADTEIVGSGELAFKTALKDGDPVTARQFETVGTLASYDIQWLDRTGGIVDFNVLEEARSLIDDHPLAIVVPAANGELSIALRETVAGVWVRADDFVHRIDASATGWMKGVATLYAMRFGRPYGKAVVLASLAPPDNAEGGAYPDEVQPPQSPIPTINVPSDGMKLFRVSLKTDSRGIVSLAYWVRDPDRVRKYLDGQIYVLNYCIAATGQSPMPMFEVVAVHVRDAFSPQPSLSWEAEIAPILVQYGNLYPIMSEGLFSFSDYDAIAANARLLYMALARDIDDPEYMPVTRDLSAGKRRALLNWLAGFLKDSPPIGVPLPSSPISQTTCPDAVAVAITGPDHPTRVKLSEALAAAKALGAGSEGKSVAVGNYLRYEASLRATNRGK